MFESEIVALFDRQRDALLALDGSAFFFELHRWWKALHSEPRLQLAIKDAMYDATRLLERYASECRETSLKVATLKPELVAAAPDIDDTDTAGTSLNLEVWVRYDSSFAMFDKIVEQARGSATPRFQAESVDDVSDAAKLITIFEGKLQEARFTTVDSGTGGRVPTKTDQHPELEPLFLRFATIREQHEYTHRQFTLEKLSSGGLALARIQKFVNDLVPAPQQLETMQDWMTTLQSYASSSFAYPPGSGASLSDLRDALFGDQYARSGTKPEAALRDWRTYVAGLVSQVHEDIVRRVAERASLVRLAHRYKERCEWHDRTRLRNLASQVAARENALTAEFARWLFDQGLSPITRPLTGDLQPDLLDPSRIYVEAKRYRDSKGRRAIVQGYWELHDAVMRLQGTQYAVREVFYVVFRESGPRYVLPPEVPGEGFVTFPILIDIAPAAESGSRQKHAPIQIPLDDLLHRSGKRQRRAKRHR